VTRITCREYHDNILFIAEGHSGYGDRGSDIVCAGISCLVYTLINTLLDEESSDRVHLVRQIIRDGYVCLEIEKFEFSKDRVNGIIDACMTGFYMLRDNYPEAVKIE
jgi:uncharacterized protein YsxB (DUF464 family)